MSKNLTLLNLKKMNSNLNKTQRVHLDENYYLDIDTNFRLTKIQLILERILEVNQYIAENKIEKFDIISYSLFLAIKQFTTLQVEDDLSTELKAMEILIDLEYFQKIIDSFGQENTQFFMEKLADALKNVSYIQDQMLEDILNKERENGIVDEEDITVTVDENEEGDENLESESTVEDNRTEVTN